MTIAPEPTEQRTEPDGVTNLRHGLLWVCVAAAAAVVALCLIATVLDLADHTDDWDGLMVMIAVIVGVPCLAIGACATWAVRSRSRVAAGITGALVSGSGVLILAQTSWGVGPLLLGATLLVTAFVAPSRTR